MLLLLLLLLLDLILRDESERAVSSSKQPNNAERMARRLATLERAGATSGFAYTPTSAV